MPGGLVAEGGGVVTLYLYNLLMRPLIGLVGGQKAKIMELAVIIVGFLFLVCIIGILIGLRRTSMPDNPNQQVMDYLVDEYKRKGRGE